MRAAAAAPWYRRTLRWGQTNLTEIDPARYDAGWWREYWRRTRVQGVIVNAGGIVAYYPSCYPLHERSPHLGGRDLFGEIAGLAHEDGLTVLARMDSNRAGERFHEAHPDWFCVDAEGRPLRASDRYIACVNGPYYAQYLPGLLREIAARSHPEGFTDNSWSGLERDRVCHCASCRERFRDDTGLGLPDRADWALDAYRRWIEWSYARRLAVWDLNDRTAVEAGGPDCRWIGMNSGDIVGQSQHLRDYRGIGRRAPIVMLDFQARRTGDGFWVNAAAGSMIHGLVGSDTLVPESTALYGAGSPSFRASAKPEPEVRLWALEGFAAGIQPWWHHIGASHEDRRQYRTAEALFRWHERNQEFLVDRVPVAPVGLVWSQRNVDFFGRDAATERVMLPQRGWIEALIAARIPHRLVHADDIASQSDGLGLLVLPELAAMSETQAEALEAFHAAGGGVIASGRTGRLDTWGEEREPPLLGELLGVRPAGGRLGWTAADGDGGEEWARHTYLRLQPGDAGSRHAVLAGFEETGIIPFGGSLEVVEALPGREVPATRVPPYPVYPPETAWMRPHGEESPALVLSSTEGGRTAYLAADVDRCAGRDRQPDHLRLLANLARWAMAGESPLEVEGPGLIDCRLHRQRGRQILHLVNLTNPGAWRPPVSELLPVGPLRVRIRARGAERAVARSLVSDLVLNLAAADGWWVLEVPSVLDHEVIVVEERGGRTSEEDR